VLGEEGRRVNIYKLCQLGAYLLQRTRSLPMWCIWLVEGTLGKFSDDSGAAFATASGIASFVLRLLGRLLVRFSAPSLTTILASLAGASDGLVIARGSSLAELEAFEDECFR